MVDQKQNALAVAVIGTGLMAKQMLKVLIKLHRPITAIYGRSLERAQALVTELGLGPETQVYDSLANLWQHDEAPYVYIATSNDVHTKNALDAMYHGKNVLLEKSMVQNIKELAEIEKTIKSEKRIFMEANLALCSPLLQRIGKLISEGEPIYGLDKVGMININYGDVPEIDANNRFFNPNLGGGMLTDIGCYVVGAAVTLLGKDLTISSSDLETDPNFNVDVRGHAVLVSNQGIRANLSMSFLETLPKTVVLGTKKGYVTISDFARSSICNIFSPNAEPVIKDMRLEILEKYGLVPQDFIGYRDITLALEVLDFEAAVSAGYERCYAENLTHYEESKAVTRLIAEIFARSKQYTAFNKR